MIQRLFIFAIGGTGSRVVKSLTMLLAAGAHIDAQEIVVIIIDPDIQNGNLTETEQLLNNYQIVNNNCVPDGPTDCFFRPKIRKLKDLDKDGRLKNDSFVYDFGPNVNDTFGKFINYVGLPDLDKKFIDTLFSQNNINSKLDIGFKGNPNVGSIVLNTFDNSPEFAFFQTIFNAQTDRIFLISSIFGGTGASGFPLLVKLLRNHSDARVNTALIGAASIGPYFNIAKPQNGKPEIDASIFVTKTKAALSYYEQNLNNTNAIYYLSDQLSSNPYPIALGKKEQRNDAHLIELIGATAIIHFCSLTVNVLKTATASSHAFEYALQEDSSNVSLKDLYPQTVEQVVGKPLLLFKYLSHLVRHHIETKSMALAWAQTIGFNQAYVNNSTPYSSLKAILVEYENWLKELKSNRRAFTPFADTKDLKLLIAGKPIKNGVVRNFDEDEFDRVFGGAYKEVGTLTDTNKKLLALLWKGINKVYDGWVKTLKIA